MTPERFRRVKDLFDAASRMTPERRGPYLDGECAGDSELRHLVDELLEGSGHAGSFAEAASGAEDLVPSEADPSSAPTESLAVGETAPGGVIGPYHILRKIGEGGMGEVWLAEQRQPIRRTVALKVIKRGLDTKQVVARFEAERQALALMNHPCVARVFDAGATPDGRPYFAMEYVQGVSITEHCDRQRLSIRDRLSLFTLVCEGVQHAHQKAIVHRDLKPSNVLVTMEGGRAVPKIIDFGIAKAMAQPFTDRTLQTIDGTMIGTPEYMSPEQADMIQDVDRRTDVYSLGVMLYELLVGALPFDPRVLRAGSADDIRRRIREEDPPTLAKRLLTLGDKGSAESARRRRVDLPILRRQLKGDLDWITVKAMEKDRSRRYESPAELAADIARHLADQPVLARPPGVAYRTRKFVRRHRSGVGIGVAVAAMVVATAISLKHWWDSSHTVPGGRIDSLAVLPFKNRDTDPNSEYLSDGMTETIINRVSQLPALTVISRESAFHYKNLQVEPRVAARELKVRAILTGYVQSQGEDLVVSAELVDTKIDRILWGERYTTKSSGILQVEEDIASRTVERMSLSLTGEEKARFTKQPTVNPEAHRWYLKGRFALSNKWETKTGAQEAIDDFNRAIGIDPDYALAYVGLSDTYYELSNIHLKPTDAMPRAEAAARKALELDDSLGAAHAALGVVKRSYDWDIDGSRRELRRAIELAPSYADAYVQLSFSQAVIDNADEAQAEIRRALELDPLSPFVREYSALSLYLTKRYAQAESELKSLIAEQPDLQIGHAYLGLVYEQTGRRREAVAELRTATHLDESTEGMAQLGHALAINGDREEALQVLGELGRMSPTRYVNPFSVALIHAALGDLDQAFVWFDRAVDERSEWISMMAVDPRLDALRGDPRFQALLRRVKLLPVSGPGPIRSSLAPPIGWCADSGTPTA